MKKGEKSLEELMEKEIVQDENVSKEKIEKKEFKICRHKHMENTCIFHNI